MLKIPLNTDNNGLAVTLTCANHYAGNITHPRQGYREMGVLEIAEHQLKTSKL